MALDPDLVARYTTEVTIDWHNACILSHPAAGTRYLIDAPQEFEGLVDGFPHLFQPVPFKLVRPQRDDSGRQDASIVICGIQDEALDFLDLAITIPTEPITCRLSIYIDGNPEPKEDPWMELTLTQISVTREAIAATITRADILNRTFPSQVYRVDTFPGLRRR